MKNKIVSIVLVLFMMMVFSPVVHAENKPDGAEWLVDEGENHVWYKIEGTTLTLGGSGAMPDWYATYNKEKTDDFIYVPWRDGETHLFKNITKIVINEGITRIGNSSFQLSPNIAGASDTPSLVEVVLPESLKSIGTNAFKFNTTLENIKFPSKLEVIDSAAFQGCGLKNVILPENLTVLSPIVFRDNENLEKLTLPSGLNEIGQWAFYGCSNLKTIMSYNHNVPNTGIDAFKNVTIDKLIIPIGSDYSSWSIYTKENVSYFYIVTFDTNGGNEIKSVMVEQNNKLVKPTNPTKENYVFDGWYEDEDFRVAFDFNKEITEDITEDITLYAKWREAESFTYKFINGDNQKLTIDDIKSFSLKIDGDYSLFKNLKIGNLDLIEDEDYTVTEGSTVITFTDKGIAKLNTLSKGEYEILVTYTNNKEVKGKLTLTQMIEPEPEMGNPKTSDSCIRYLVTGIISLIGIISISFYTSRKLVK